jgi:nucleotide-binding universal stress UspA family protein
MELDLKVQAEQARRRLMTTAEEMGLQWSFRTVRGDVIAEILSAALDADILSLGRVSYPLTRQFKLGSTALAATTKAPRTVLLAPKTTISQPIVAVYDGTKKSKQALKAATQMAKAYSCNLTIIVVATSEEQASNLKQEIKDLVKSKTLEPRYRLLSSTKVSNLVKAIQEESCGALVLSSESPLAKDETFQKLLYEMDCLLLLVK